MPVLTLTRVSPTEITLSWEEMDGAVGYQVERDGVIVSSVTEPEYNDNTLVAGQRHVYRARVLWGAI